uniref:Uncharacterized protein n=1 Tax=Schizaphis graminum TaxID=13262 RepID=A0A2S2P4X8_SCHGA
MTYDNALQDIKTQTVPDLYEINIGNTLASFLKEFDKLIPKFSCNLSEISNVNLNVLNMFKKSIFFKCSVKNYGKDVSICCADTICTHTLNEIIQDIIIE